MLIGYAISCRDETTKESKTVVVAGLNSLRMKWTTGFRLSCAS